MDELNSVHLVSNLEPALPCVYGLLSRICSYDPQSAPVYFSLGEAVATLGLTFTALQLSNAISKIVLQIKERYVRDMIWYMSVLGLFMVLIASIIPQFPHNLL